MPISKVVNDIAKSPYKGDLIGDFIAACNVEGILPGAHYSIPDSLNDAPINYRGPVSAAYFEVIKKHLTELNTRYPDLRILVCSGSPFFIENLPHTLQRQVAFLQKPFMPKMLAEAVQNLLKERPGNSSPNPIRPPL